MCRSLSPFIRSPFFAQIFILISNWSTKNSTSQEMFQFQLNYIIKKNRYRRTPVGFFLHPYLLSLQEDKIKLDWYFTLTITMVWFSCISDVMKSFFTNLMKMTLKKYKHNENWTLFTACIKADAKRTRSSILRPLYLGLLR